MDLAPCKELLDGIHLLLKNHSLAVERGQEPADLADDVTEDEGRKEGDTRVILPLAVGDGDNVGRARADECAERPVEGQEVARSKRERGLLALVLYIVVDVVPCVVRLLAELPTRVLEGGDPRRLVRVISEGGDRHPSTANQV